MEHSVFIAKLMGPFMLVMGLAMLKNPGDLKSMAGEFLNNRALMFISGSMALLGGLVLVNIHNIWVADWRVIITLMGWAMVVAGIIRIGFPKLVQSMGAGMLGQNSLLMGAALVWAGIGAALSYFGYL